MNSHSMWRRLSRRLQESREEFGPVTGELPLLRVGMIWLAANFVVTTQLTGTLFVPGVSWLHAVGLIVFGSIIGAIVLVSVGNIGTRTGLPTMALTKGSLGLRGSYVAVSANVAILMGWSWVQAMLAGVTVDYVISETTGFSNPALFSVLCQVSVVALAIFGHEGIARVEPYLAIVMLAIMGYIFYVAFSSYTVADYIAISADEGAGWSSIAVFDVVVATAVSWTVLSADFNRFAISQKAGVVGAGVGYVLSTSIAMCLGATAMAYLLLKGSPIASFDPAVIVAEFGIPIAFVIFVSVMATNTMVIYGMVTSVVNMTPERKIDFLPTALILGAISIVGATWMGLLEQFTAFLSLIGALFIPVFAIMIADYYVVQRGYDGHDILVGRAGRYWYTGGVNLLAFVVWIVGFAVALSLTNFAWSPVGATLPTFILSFVLYLGGAALAGKIVSRRQAGSEA